MTNDPIEFRVKKKIRGISCRQSLARCVLPPRFRSTRLLFLLFINLIWILLLWSGVFIKAVSDDSNDYIRHYTNWMWTVGAIYYTLDFLGMLLESRYMEMILLLIPWWIVFANINIVFWLTFIMVYDNPGTLTDNFKENGGDLYPGTVFLGDRIFHILPVVMAYINMFLRIPDFIDIYDSVFGSSWEGHAITERMNKMIKKELAESDYVFDKADLLDYKLYYDENMDKNGPRKGLDKEDIDRLLIKKIQSKNRIKKFHDSYKELSIGHNFVSSVKQRNEFYFGTVPDNSASMNVLPLYIILTFIVSFIIFLTYYNIFDFNEVYEVDTPIWVGLLAAIGASGLNTIPFLVITSPMGKSIRKRFMSSWTVSDYDPSAEDEYIYYSSNRKDLK